MPSDATLFSSLYLKTKSPKYYEIRIHYFGVFE